MHNIIEDTFFRQDSFFEGLHLSVQKVLFMAADWVEHPGKPADQAAKDHGVSRAHVVLLHNLFRDLTQQWWNRAVESGGGKLGGPGKPFREDLNTNV